MMLLISDSKKSSKLKVAKAKGKIPYPVTIFLDYREVSSGTIQCSAREVGSTGCILSSQKPLIIGSVYRLVCRSKKSHTELDVVIEEAKKPKHHDYKYIVEIVGKTGFDL